MATKLGLALCELSFAPEASPKDIYYLFTCGCSIAEISEDETAIGDFQEMLHRPEVASSPWRTWRVLQILMRFPDTACDALMRAIELELDTEDGERRDKFVLCLMEEPETIPASDECIRTLCNLIVQGRVRFYKPEKSVEAIALAQEKLDTKP